MWINTTENCTPLFTKLAQNYLGRTHAIHLDFQKKDKNKIWTFPFSSLFPFYLLYL